MILVDGQNPAPVEIVKHHRYTVLQAHMVQDFVHEPHS